MGVHASLHALLGVLREGVRGHGDDGNGFGVRAVEGADGARHGKTAAQVALRWLIQLGAVALTKTATPARLAENIAVFDFAMTEADMAEIATLARPNGRIVDPAGLAPQWEERA